MRLFLDTNVILDIPLGREGAQSSEPSSTQLARNALALGLNDLEDAMQVVVAEAVAADLIVTRNLRDFSRLPVPAIGPEDFLARFKG